MTNRGKRYVSSVAELDEDRQYEPSEAVALAKRTATAHLFPAKSFVSSKTSLKSLTLFSKLPPYSSVL